MKAELIRQYVKLNKENKKVIRYTYAVDGTDEEKAMFADYQGDFLRVHDDGRYLWFSDKVGVENVNFTSKGKPYGDTTNMDAMVQQIEQLPEGELKTAMAQELAKRLMGNIAMPATPSAPVQEKSAEESGDLGDL